VDRTQVARHHPLFVDRKTIGLSLIRLWRHAQAVNNAMEALPKGGLLEIISFASCLPEGQLGLEILISAHNS